MKNILGYLERSRDRYPDKISFADPEKEITYGELVQCARRIGTALAAVAYPGSPVPVFMGKSVDTICVFFGAVYAGCFYALLDTKHPRMRLYDILRTLDTDFIVTSHAYDEDLATFGYEGKILYAEDLMSMPEDADLLARIRSAACDIDPLYCNFTSGSTGIPKGVLVGHRSVIDFIDIFTELFDIRDSDVIGNQAPFDFDVSVKDIYGAIAVGATVQIIPTKFFSIPTELLDYICERHVTVLIWAVSAMCIVSQLHGFDYRIPSEVRKVLFSGEVMPIRHLTEWQNALPDATFVNLYGPTEITCNCTYYVIDRRFERGESIPCGIPFPNEKVFLLDSEDRLVTEPGKTGEICVSGTALALGYYNAPEQTEKAFVQNPLNRSYLEPVYRTGDLAYIDEEGLFCFSSRKDFQIKHMGHRIELGEIDRALDAVTEVERAVCTYEKNKIVAYYVGQIDKKELAAKLATRLPRFMIPNRFVQMQSLPLTKNGKIDRKALADGTRSATLRGQQ